MYREQRAKIMTAKKKKKCLESCDGVFRLSNSDLYFKENSKSLTVHYIVINYYNKKRKIILFQHLKSQNFRQIILRRKMQTNRKEM